MGHQAGSAMTIAVTKAGGLGQVGSAGDMNALRKNLDAVQDALPRYNGVLPVGVGFLPFITKLEEALLVIETYQPAVVWLFAAKETPDYVTWTSRIRALKAPVPQIWVQVGSVAAAVEIGRSCKPDVMSIQGSDAGGHGYEKSAGIISLLPEVSDALSAVGLDKIVLVAAGGITEARSAAAALALGAQGVVMGTRFLSSPEALVHPLYRSAVLAASDGGTQTAKAKLFDELRGPNAWPDIYDGRCIVSESFMDHAAGVDIDEIRHRHAEAVKMDSQGFGIDGKGRAAMWAGTGVGLVREEMGAGEIVEEVRRGVQQVLDSVRARL
ncbi:hypothetical protein LTR86_005175 [Recurvomyces mirabilis]|nr:hypothetical protein LTR86_005175 [Recurvomyces mirabilis]